MPKTSGRDTSKRDVAIVIVLVLVAAGLITYLVARPSTQDAATAQGGDSSAQGTRTGQQGTNPLADELPRRDENDPFAMGDVDAPVVMVMYSDYRCPFCAKFSRDTEPELVERYVDSGVLRIEWRDFPIFGDQSLAAARAGRAAAEQGKFWDFNHAVYAGVPETSKLDVTPEALLDFARQAGVPDLEKFAADMEDTRFDAAIGKDVNEAVTIGATSTPTFVVNGRPILGAQPLSTFVDTIEEAANEK